MNKQKKDRLGCVISIAIIVILFIWFPCRTRVGNSKNIPGNKRKFDPVVALEKVNDFAGKDKVLTLIEAFLIKSDGTIDVKESYSPTIKYLYLGKYIYPPVEEKKKNEDLPLGVDPPPEAKKSKVYQRWTTVIIRRPYKFHIPKKGYGILSSEGTWKKHGGMASHSESKGYLFSEVSDDYIFYKSAPPPKSFKIIWDKAIEIGAPYLDAVANITYDPKKGYTFEIRNTEYKYKFDLDANLIEE